MKGIDISDLVHSSGPPEPEEKTPLQKAGVAGTLLDQFDSLNNPYTFEPRQLVQWKQGMANRRMTSPMVITQVLSEPCIVDKDTGTPYFNEKLDVVVGVIESGGEFNEYHLDSRRLEPYTGPMPDSV